MISRLIFGIIETAAWFALLATVVHIVSRPAHAAVGTKEYRPPQVQILKVHPLTTPRGWPDIMRSKPLPKPKMNPATREAFLAKFADAPEGD